MQRFLLFLPSVMGLFIIALVVLLPALLLYSRYSLNMKNPEWRKQNYWKIFWLGIIPDVIIIGPAIEEIIFRLPLVILFNSLTVMCWWGIGLMATLFATVHWFMQAFDNYDGEYLTSLSLQTRKPVNFKSKKMKLIRVASAFLTGLGCGFFTIKFQSLWISFFVHAQWNTLAVILEMVNVYIKNLSYKKKQSQHAG